MCVQIDWMALKTRQSWVWFTQKVHAIILWCDDHAGLGGWVGAGGAVIAVFIAWWISRDEYQRVLQVEKDRMNAEINMISRTVSDFDVSVLRYIELSKANDPESVGYYNKHLLDPERTRMNSIGSLPITQRPSIELYDAFSRYFNDSNSLVIMSVDTRPFGTLEQWKQAHDNALKTLRNALKDAKK